MKLLVIHSAELENDKVSAVDLWRISRPIAELKKHVDWEITERAGLINEFDQYKAPEEFTDEELEKAAEELSQYDVVYGVYSKFMNPAIFSLMMVLKDRHGVKLAIDVDDNVFAINEDNLGWWMKMTHHQTFMLQQAIRSADYLITSSEILRKELAERNPNALIQVVPNYISADYKAGPPVNGTKVKIGYFGGASHFSDLHESGFLPALAKLMHENKNIIAESCGIPSEEYLPKARYTYNEGAKGHDWVNKIIPSLNYDIAVAPLLANDFNKCKTAIKWMEAAKIHAPLVASNVSPYKEVIRNKFDGLLVANDSTQWYDALKLLVDDEVKRKELAEAAEKRVNEKHMIENNWEPLKKALEKIHANNITSKQSIILQA